MRWTTARIAAFTAIALLASVIQAGVVLANHLNDQGQVQPPFPDRTLTLPEDGETPNDVRWRGDSATAANEGYNSGSGEPCGKTPEDYCDITLLRVDVPADFWDTRTGGVRVVLDDYQPVPASDFDLYIYESDANGFLGNLVDASGNVPGEHEEAQIPEARGYYLIQVVYFATVQSDYRGTADFVTGVRTPTSGIPPDVDNPPGLQEVLASDPSTGWRSRSEMHVAQNPVDPDLLVAGSKFYNKDLQDSLGEYEFKVGSYASLDGGGSWADLGQVATCAAGQSTPDQWPSSSHTCYPRDDPNRDGLDRVENYEGREHPQNGDYGEEYITSDPWVQWDDEGNAYMMVLDHPPFGLDPEGNGWGMTLHRWDSVSEEDIENRETWGPRLPINAYQQGFTRANFLDDKNTFAVNNAGADGDGQTGIIVACWGQNIEPLIKQQVVCKRSLDKGETWQPPEGVPASQPVSSAQQLVIGVHVVASKTDPNTFYATWLQYATGIAAQSTIDFAVSKDGGLTWVHRQAPAAIVEDIPRQFPNQRFRNLTIPIMAAGPDDELYITYAEYVNATRPGADEDGLEADIRIIKSTNEGVTWSSPATVHSTNEQPNANADQFQPYVEVTESGQVNVIYFDRRLDARIVDNSGEDPVVLHSGNYFTDVWLSRSNDDGQTFSETRLTHDATDPEYNAPVSGSGLFFGDYQGLVANDCEAIPFVNDTHLANDEFIDPGPVRDPAFDDGLPSSRYQEAVSWQVPNTAGFGGPANTLPEGCGEDIDPPPPTECPGRENEQGNHLVGTSGNDVIEGTGGRDVICGRGGNDTLVGKGGNDLILGGDGDDTLVGGEGRDTLRGENDNDTLRGNAGSDDLGDLAGNNTFKGGPGNDQMRGGGGADRFVSGPGNDDARARGGRDFVAGGAGDDDLRGGAGHDDLRGYRGHDALRGGRGSDSLKGGRGNDLLSGGRGTDVCRGGPGQNAYRGCEERL